jgi:hypothetical protein
VQAFVAAHPADHRLERLPPYAPELDPEELRHGAVKREPLNALPASPRRASRRLGHRPIHLHGCFAHAGLSVPPLQ